jgi:hypothetical protein
VGVLNSAGRADRSATLDRGVRVGLVVYGVMHLVIAATAFQLTLGERGNASQRGAFAELAQTPLGSGVLYLVAVGFAALVVWQALEAAAGHRDADGGKRVLERVGSAAKAVVYATLGYSAAAMAVGAGSGSGSSTDGLTARLMSAPGGQLLVGLVGVGLVAVGGYLGYRGWSERFTKDLDGTASSGERRPILLLGKVGHLGKGASLAAVGLLFVVAAARHQPEESGGLDVALHELLRQPFGPVLVGAVALGLACFGLYCFAWARHLNR